MQFYAKGASVAKLPSGMMQVTVEYYRAAHDEEPARVVMSAIYVVANTDALHAKVVHQLQALKEAADDLDQPLTVVDTVLGTI